LRLVGILFPHSNTYSFSIATIVARTRLYVTLHAHCLSCWMLNLVLRVL